MSIIKVDYGTLGGGCKSGTVNNTTAASQTVTINTGLSSITKFTLVATPSLSSYSDYRFVLTHDGGNNYYNSAVIYTNGCYGQRGSVGSEANIRAWKLESISGGTVVVKSPSSDSNYGACKDIHWYAE